METDDSVLVIVSEEGEEFVDLPLVNNFTENIEITLKVDKKGSEDEFESEYLEDAQFLEGLENLKAESDDNSKDSDDSEHDDTTTVQDTLNNILSKIRVKNEEYRYINSPNVRRRKTLKPWQYKSFVKELKKRDPKLKNNQQLLVETLAEIMSRVKVPVPPENFYILKEPSKFICAYCSAVFQTRTMVSRHYQARHGSYYLVCYACGMDFRCTLKLYRHEKACRAPDATVVLKARAHSIGSKSRGRPFINCYPRPPKPAPAKIPCSKCSAIFTTKVALQSHENLHKGLRPYRCESCLNAYTSLPALRRHVKTHTQDQYICDHCNKHFKTKATITEHMNTHRPVKRFQCEHCEQRFAYKVALVHHVDKVHKKLPPSFVCHLCDTRFARMCSLKKHMLKVHGCTLLSRNAFQKVLPKMSDVEFQSYLEIQAS